MTGDGGGRQPMARDIDDLAEWAELQGWQVKRNRQGSLRFFAPDGTYVVRYPATLCNERQRFLEVVSAVRHYGIVWPKPSYLGRARADARLKHTRSVRFLLAIGMRLLPPSERDRYLEEFRAELLDVPRNTRLSHALSLVRGVFVLRLRRGPKTKAANAAVRRAKG
jgi:hypothetical protein